MELFLWPVDTLFFRGPQPFNAGESVFLDSMFPPFPSTVQGLVRTALLEAFCVDLSRYARDDCASCDKRSVCNVARLVGSRGSPVPAGLEIWGPYLVRRTNGGPAGDGIKRYFLAPADLVAEQASSEDKPRIVALAPGNEVLETDLGATRLPAVRPGARPVRWISEEGLAKYLAAREVPVEEVLLDDTAQDRVYVNEEKVGIGQDRSTKTTVEGLLYAVRMVRLAESYGLGVTVEGLSEEYTKALHGRLLRLGGEGRMVVAEVCPAVHCSGLPAMVGEAVGEINKTARARVVLLQPGKFGGSWLPPGCQPADRPSTERDAWRWQTNGPATLELKILSARIEKPRWIGGWDLANNCPRDLTACVPAGSVYYCALDDASAAEKFVQLHNTKIGEDSRSGFGHIVVGAWDEGSWGPPQG